MPRQKCIPRFFSTAERRADIASPEYAGSFGDSLVSVPQPAGALDSVLYTIETTRELEDLADELTSTPFLDSVSR